MKEYQIKKIEDFCEIRNQIISGYNSIDDEFFEFIDGYDGKKIITDNNKILSEIYTKLEQCTSHIDKNNFDFDFMNVNDSSYNLSVMVHYHGKKFIKHQRRFNIFLLGRIDECTGLFINSKMPRTIKYLEVNEIIPAIEKIENAKKEYDKVFLENNSVYGVRNFIDHGIQINQLPVVMDGNF